MCAWTTRQKKNRGKREKEMSKYRAVRTTVDSITFASKKEARRYGELRIMQMAKLISGLELQPRFPIALNEIHICDYVADFAYYDTKTGKRVIEDAKGMRLPLFKLKKRLAEAAYGIVVVET